MAASQPKLDQPITTAEAVGTIDNAPEIVRFATATAGFGGLLRGDPAMRDLSCNDVIALAQSVRQPDTDGWRAQLIALMYRAEPLIDLPPAR
jgi:Ca-activated chloride channel family protein